MSNAYKKLNKAALIELLSTSDIQIDDLQAMKKSELIEKVEAMEAEKAAMTETIENCRSAKLFDKSAIRRAMEGHDLQQPVEIVQFWWNSALSPLAAAKNEGLTAIVDILPEVKKLQDADYPLNPSTFFGKNPDGDWVNSRITSIIDLMQRGSNYRFEAVDAFKVREFQRLVKPLKISTNEARKKLKDPDEISRLLAKGRQGATKEWGEILRKIPSKAGYLVTSSETSSTGTGEKEKTSGVRTVGWAKMSINTGEKGDYSLEFKLYDGPVLAKASNDADVIELLALYNKYKGLIVGNDLKALIVDPVLVDLFSLGRQLYGVDPAAKSTVHTVELVAEACRNVGMSVGAAVPMSMKTKKHAESGSSLLISQFTDRLKAVQTATGIQYKTDDDGNEVIEYGKKARQSTIEAAKAEMDLIESQMKGFEIVLSYSIADCDELLGQLDKLRSNVEKAEKALQTSTPAKKRKTKAQRAFEDAQKALHASALAIYASCLKAGMSHEDAVKTARHADPSFDCAPPAKPEKADQA